MTTATDSTVLESPRKNRKRISRQYISYLIHSFVGLKLTLLLTIVLLTGTIAVFMYEIDWLIYSEMRATPQEERLNAGVLLDNLQAAYPDNGMYYFQSNEGNPYMAASARYTDDNGGWRAAFINPYTGEVQGDTQLLSVGQFLGYLHATLFLPAIGNSLVNALGVLTLISLVTGLLAAPKFWRYFFKLPRTGNLRVFLGDLHKLIGLWSLWFVFIIGISGSWWFYQNPLVRYADAPNPVEPYKQKPLLSYEDLDKLGTETPRRLSSAEIVEAVLEVYPGAQIDVLRQPEHNAEPYEVVINPNHWLVPKWRGNRIMINPYNGEIIDRLTPADMTVGQRIDLAMYPLHYGTWGESGSKDLVVKAFWFLGGVAMTALAVTGLIVNLKRTRRAARQVAALSPTMRRLRTTWRAIRPWGGPMGIFKYLNVICVVGVVVGTGTALTLGSQGTKGSGFIYTEQELGPWKVAMNAVAGALEKDLPPIRAGAKTNLNVQIGREALQQIKFIYARVGKPRSKRAPGTLVHGPIGSKHVHLPIPKRLKDGAELWLTAETWDGTFYQTAWPLRPDGEKTRDARK